MGLFHFSVHVRHVVEIKKEYQVDSSPYTVSKAEARLMAPSTTLIVLSVSQAMALDVLTVNAVTPTEGSNANTSLLLSLALPYISLSLAVTLNVYGYIRQHSTDHDRFMEEGHLATDHERCRRALNQRLESELQMHPHTAWAELSAN